MNKSINMLLCIITIAVANSMYAMQPPVMPPHPVNHEEMRNAYANLKAQINGFAEADFVGNFNEPQLQALEEVKNSASAYSLQANQRLAQKWARQFAILARQAQNIINRYGAELAALGLMELEQ